MVVKQNSELFANIAVICICTVNFVCWYVFKHWMIIFANCIAFVPPANKYIKVSVAMLMVLMASLSALRFISDSFNNPMQKAADAVKDNVNMNSPNLSNIQSKIEEPILDMFEPDPIIVENQPDEPELEFFKDLIVNGQFVGLAAYIQENLPIEDQITHADIYATTEEGRREFQRKKEIFRRKMIEELNKSEK